MLTRCSLSTWWENSLPSNIATATTPDTKPAAPTSLTATVINANQVDLTWANNANNQTGYRVERALVTNGTTGAFNAIATLGANAVAYSDKTTTPLTAYAYRVFAFNASANSLPSNVATVTTPLAKPADPTSLKATAIYSKQVDLAWVDNANNETGYRVERALVTNGTPGAFAAIATLGPNVAAYSDLTTAAVTTYAYRVFAFNAAGNSLPSNVATVTTPYAAVPAPPTNLTATLSYRPSRVQLSWKDNSNNENLFQVWRSINGGTFTQIATVNRSLTRHSATGGTVTFTNTNLTVDGTYAYYVIAVNTAPILDQPSASSNTASITVLTPPAAPTKLAGSAVRILGDRLQDQVTLTWIDNASNETGFIIQRSTSPSFTNATTYTVGANVTTFTQNVSRTQDFYYRIYAPNAAGNSAWSNVVFVTTP